jgi:hypothetical protein
MTFFKPTVILIFCFICLFSCSSVEQRITGLYVFEFPSGEFQILSIASDNSFSQRIYLSKEDFSNGRFPKFENSGTWIDNGKDLTFVHWLSYCENRDPKQVLNHPIQVTMANVYFNNSMIDSKDYVSIYMETGYVFKRMEENK